MEEAGQPACDAPEEQRRFVKFLEMEDPLSHLTPSHILPFVKLKEAVDIFSFFQFYAKERLHVATKGQAGPGMAHYRISRLYPAWIRREYSNNNNNLFNN